MTETPAHPARLLISSSRKPITYVPAAKRLLQEQGEVNLSALGIACSSMVTVAEILKSRNLAVEKRVGTMLELLEDEPRPRQKPKMEVLLVKTAEFDAILAAERDANVAGESGEGDAVKRGRGGRKGKGKGGAELPAQGVAAAANGSEKDAALEAANA